MVKPGTKQTCGLRVGRTADGTRSSRGSGESREVLRPSQGLRYDKTRVGGVGQDRCCGSENNLREGVGLTQGLPRKATLELMVFLLQSPEQLRSETSNIKSDFFSSFCFVYLSVLGFFF